MSSPAGREDYSTSDGSDSGGSDDSLIRRFPLFVGRRLSTLNLPGFRADVATKYVQVGYRIVYRNMFVFAILVGLMATGVQLLRMTESGETRLLEPSDVVRGEKRPCAQRERHQCVMFIRKEGARGG